MATNQAFHTRTALAEGLRELFKQLEERLSLRSPVNVYLAGGMAVHLYTASRVTTDVDAEFGGRVYLPNDLMVEVTLEDGTQQVVYLDTNCHPDAIKAMPDDERRQKFAGLCLRRGSLKKGSDVGIKM